jgi:hypothetical protein
MRRGGAFLAQGADTCVYAPAVGCAPGTQTPADIPPGNYVSRITDKVTPDGNELANQGEVKQAIRRIQEKHPDQEIEKFFNVAVATCTPLFKVSDIMGAPRFAGDEPIRCDNMVAMPGVMADKVNFITTRQDEDVGRSRRPKPVVRAQLRKLFHAVAYLNDENVVHTDAHFGNIAWMGDRIVMHDWGRAAVGIKGFKNFIKRWNMRTVANRLALRQYLQFKGPCDLLETCPIKLTDDTTSHRFMKFYDVASMAPSLGAFGLVPAEAIGVFSTKLSTLWKDATIPTNEMSMHIHQFIEELFDAGEAPPHVPIPNPEVSAPSTVAAWEQWVAANKYKKVSIEIREKSDATNVLARVIATIGGKWTAFEIDAAAQATLEAAGYKIRGTFVDVNPPEIIMLRAQGLQTVPKLLVPISFISEDRVILVDAPLSSFSLSPGGGGRGLNQTQRFCKCIKKVRKTIKNEKGPIAICVKSVLQKNGRTLKRFTCGRNGRVVTQRAKH